MTMRDSKTKIVATIGPASRPPGTLEDMIRAGMNIARLNLAHGEFAEHAEIISAIRAAARAMGRRVAILADLPGPKLRIGNLAEQPIELEAGQRFCLTVGEFTGDATRASITFRTMPRVVKSGDTIFLNDGLVQLRVESVTEDTIACEIVVGGPLLSHKGINLPGVDLGVSAFTDRDKECLKFALEQGVDAVGQSFVQSADDIRAVRAAAQAAGGEPLILAKIERSAAIERIDEILEAADGIMVARGDLGVEIPIERIAVAQKELIRRANLHAKPAITATQMLLSMVENRRPTRAEVTDVANAILDGTDCVMLSEESAVGAHPVDAVGMLSGIAKTTEPHVRARFGPDWQEPAMERADDRELVLASVAHIAARTAPLGILVPAASGASARRLAAFRQAVWITAVGQSKKVCQNLQFVYGVEVIDQPEQWTSWPDFARSYFKTAGPGRILLAEGTARPDGGTNRFEIVDV
jgi:pyruvate kinase